LVLTGKGAKYQRTTAPADWPAGTQTHVDLAAFAEHLLALPV
jgi:hypothetical protein